MISLVVSSKKLFHSSSNNWWQAEVPHELGLIHIVGYNDTLIGVGFNEQVLRVQRYLADQKIICMPRNLTFTQLMAFEKILAIGTPFQAIVWQTLLEIPWGAQQTYSDIAHRINRPKAVRAVGTAIGANPVSILIPCHRVVPKSGGIGNYYWGADVKAALLAWEADKENKTISNLLKNQEKINS